MNRALFKRQLNGNRWDARIYDWFVQRRYGPYPGNRKPKAPTPAPASGEVHGSGNEGAARQVGNESFGVSEIPSLLLCCSLYALANPLRLSYTSPSTARIV